MREAHCSFHPASGGIHAPASSSHCQNLPSFPVVDCNLQFKVILFILIMQAIMLFSRSDTVYPNNAGKKRFTKALYA